jgi:sialic acid synthase SpsE
MEIIAEIGQNHNGDMTRACEMIKKAKENGADAVKFQVYNAQSLFPKEDNPWFEYNCKTELSRDDISLLAEKSEKAGIEFLASVFDSERIAWLEEVGVKRYKVASRSVYDSELIQALCSTGKPLLVSLGMWNKKEFPNFETSARVDFLYCVSKYPAPASEMRLDKVDFTSYSGLSDHTLGMSSAMQAFSRGARIVEKHFTLDKNAYGPDHSLSMDSEELKFLDIFRKKLKEDVL